MPDMRNDRAFDAAELARKYDEERAKRLRSDGVRQYSRLEGKFAHYAEDPHMPLIDRDPVTKDVEVAILGGGWTAILAGVELRRAGVEDICMIEKAGDFGGAWYWNRYPGVACDVESYIYMPLLEETGRMPSANFASGKEIFEHAKNLARRYRLYDGALLQTAITDARWDADAARWIISTDRGDRIRARFFGMTTGAQQTAKLPAIPGIDSFKGRSFHTSRWDFAYTGGDSLGNLTKLADKRVAIIGTGASAIQCIPHLAEWSRHLTVFQRTPSTIDFRNERPTDPEWYRSQPPGWQRRRIENFSRILTMIPVEEDLIRDGWTNPLVNLTEKIKPGMSEAEIGELFQMEDFRTCEAIRARVDEVVKDPVTAESLKAWYNRMCKRPCFHDGYLDVYNRPNVTLVDTRGKGVDRISEHGVMFDGRECEVDCIVYSTGFELSPYSPVPLIPVTGRDGITLAEKWKDGATTMHGFHINGFPNLFMMSIIQSAWSANATHMLHEMGRHVALTIKELRERKVRTVEVTEEAESAWVAHHVTLAAQVAKTWDNCTPGYFNNEGTLDQRSIRNGSYGDVMGLIGVLEKWRGEGKLDGLRLAFD